MRKHQIILVIATLLLPCSFVMAQKENVEIGVQGGAGFYWGIPNQTAEDGTAYTRTTKVGLWIADTEDKMPPGFETYGAFIRYRFDNHWNVTVSATRQRLYYKEYPNTDRKQGASYYNAMWHLDATAEYNILNYSMDHYYFRAAKTYRVTPYVLAGVGITMYNKQAILRQRSNEASTNYPLVGKNDLLYDSDYANEIGTALYIPVGIGVKWRINHNWQLQASAQYHLYISGTNPNGLNSNLEGGSKNIPYNKLAMKPIGGNHDILIQIGVAYNFGQYQSAKSHLCMCSDY